ncbi:olfactory receptor 14J1-like [Sorex fumeus]|uniref:olfactory receptor 14J1-like n=1 Tax=Sorex fumeus TaxID=62283 RepID=UPI0024ACCBEC|nr:olfactory receptor 14J1-like [Sorex fumeus]
MANDTVVTEFVLLGFSDASGPQTLPGSLLLLAFLAALLGNGLLVALATWDPQLHTPMYFFLRNLSFIDLCFISATVPKFALNALVGRRTISLPGCVLQVLAAVCFASAEVAVLTVMAYDRYVAICRPLHYEAVMSPGACGHMAVASYLSGGISGAMHTSATFSTGFRTNEIHHFFCDIPQVLLLADASSARLGEAGVTALTAGTALGCFAYISSSYARIFSALRSLASAQGRAKALSTCLPHLLVVTLFVGTGAVAYLKPPSRRRSSLDLALSVFYTVLPPVLNPVIYSLRNKDLRAALGRALGAPESSRNARALSGL